MPGYQTKQKGLLLDFMTTHSQQSFSVEELTAAMERECLGAPVPGKSTVYRLIKKLVDEGTVKRFSENHGRTFCYQIMGGKNCATHLHLKCKKCGRLYHMDNRISQQIYREILANDAFALDEKETVLFGVCKNCR